MKAEEIAQRLGGKRNGSGWAARCPAHDDKTPSLSISEGEGGRVLFHCHAGCEQTAVIDALRKLGMWSEPKGDQRRQPVARPRGNGAVEISTPRHPQLGEPTATFDYHDPKGNLIGVVCRWDTAPGKKEIRPAVPDGTGWRWQGFPKPHALYRLPDIAAHADRPVLVVEGEKAADAAREIVDGYVVTTWPHGAKAVADADWTPLKGRHVVLWPDADDPGRQAMRAVADRLQAIGAHSVRGVKLPDGLPKGWDLADAIPADLDPVALIGRAVNVLADRLAALPIRKASAIDATEYASIRWAVPNLVPDGVAILAGPKSRGKSFISLDMALAVARGGSALGNVECSQGGVLYLGLEDSERRIRDRMRAILQGAPVPDGLEIATEWKTLDNGGLADIEAWIVARPNARLVIVDVLAKVKGKPDATRGVYDQDYATITPFHALARKYSIAIVLVHHTNKGAAADPVLRISGTMGLSGAADTTLVLSREAREMNGTLDVRGRDVAEREIALQFDPDTGCVTQLGAAEDFRKSEQRRAVIRALAQSVEPMHPVDIAEVLGRKRGTVRWLLSEMHKAGEINRLPNGKYYAAQ